MDLIAGCKDKLAYFRIKELKDILTQLGLSKQGKKQDLIDRILRTFSDEEDSKTRTKKHAIRKEEVAKLVEDTYRKMQVSGATDLASKGQGVSDGSNAKIKGETEDHFQLDTKVRCLCGNPLESGSMIKCEDPRCNVWQHMGCVLIPEKPTDGDPPVPELFYCEICRLNRADPFLLSVAHPLYPVKLTSTSIPSDGTNPVQTVEKTFQLTRADRDLLSKQEYDVQAWCMLLNDKVPYRMQWPQYADLQINGVPMRAINRPGSQLLGANGRDDGPVITPCTKDGINKICLTGCDARIFCLGVRMVKKRTVTQILHMIPKESDGERFEDALARVRRCIGGGTSNDNADSDSDIEVVADSFVVNLRCPMSGSRMKVAGRFKACAHMGCFDLDVFVEMNQRSRKWQCPICLKNYSLEHIIIDPYFNRITSSMRHCGEDVTEIEAKPDGSWRVKSKSESERRELGDLVMWHSPDGTLCAPPVVSDVKPKLEALKQVKQEGFSDGHTTGLKLGIRKNPNNGFWELSKPDDMNTSSGNKLHEKFENNIQKVIPMSSSATGSRDGEDPSVNQDGGGNFDISGNNGIELDSMSLNLESAYGFEDRAPSARLGDAEVIVLSDSDEENDMLLSSGTAYNNNNGSDAGVPFPVPHPVMDPYPESQTLGNGSCLGLFNSNEDEFENIWSLPSGAHAGPPFQLFSSEADASHALVDLQHGSVNCPQPMNGYTLTPDLALESASLLPDSSVGCSDADINDGLVDNPLPFGGDDPSLQIFLPTRPSHVTMQSDLRNQADVSNGMRTDDWISLRLGGGASASGGHGESTAVNLTSRQQMPPKEAPLLGMGDGRSEKSSRPRSGSPFSFPRQKRSVRPRLYLSIDSDSE